NGPLARAVLFRASPKYSVRSHASRHDRLGLRLGLGCSDRSYPITRRDVSDQIVHQARIGRRAKARRGVPACARIEAWNIGRYGVVPHGDVVERSRIRLVTPADLVEGGIEVAQTLAGQLVSYRSNGRPLGRAGTGSAE